MMTQKQYNAALQKLGLSSYTAAPWLGISERQSQRYASGQQSVNRTVELLLQAYLEHGLPQFHRQ